MDLRSSICHVYCVSLIALGIGSLFLPIPQLALLFHLLTVSLATIVGYVHCRVTSIRLCVIIKREGERWIKKWCVEKSAYLWRVLVKDFKVWQKPYSLTLIAEGHLWNTYTQRRLQGSHCWERNVTLYTRLQTKVLLYACGCVHSSSLVKGWLKKLVTSLYLMCEIQIFFPKRNYVHVQLFLSQILVLRKGIG